MFGQYESAAKEVNDPTTAASSKQKRGCKNIDGTP